MPSRIKELQLVIPPANQIVKFMQGVDEVLESHMMHMVGSWKGGAAMTVVLTRPLSLADILNKLREMPEVAEIKEKIPAKKNLLGLLEKSAAMTRGKPSRRKSILVTLKQGQESKVRRRSKGPSEGQPAETIATVSLRVQQRDHI